MKRIETIRIRSWSKRRISSIYGNCPFLLAFLRSFSCPFLYFPLVKITFIYINIMSFLLIMTTSIYQYIIFTLYYFYYFKTLSTNHLYQYIHTSSQNEYITYDIYGCFFFFFFFYFLVQRFGILIFIYQ